MTEGVTATCRASRYTRTLVFLVIAVQAQSSSARPSWYIFTMDDVPKEQHANQVVTQISEALDNAVSWGQGCLGGQVHGNDNEFRTIDHQWQCLFFNRLYTSPLRTYDWDEADFVVIPSAPEPSQWWDKPTNEGYYEDAAKVFTRRKEKPHVFIVTKEFTRQMPGFEKSPEVAKDFFYIVQQYPAYLFTGYDSWWMGQRWQFNPEDFPGTKALADRILGAPWLGQVKLHQGAERLHVPFDEDAITAQKEVILKGIYAVRTDQRQYLSAACTSSPDICEEVDIYNNDIPEETRWNVVEGYRSAWGSLMPQGDEPTRTAQNDAWLVDSIPVFLAEPEWMIPYLPFTELIDYRTIAYFMKHIDKAMEEGQDEYLQQEFMPLFSVERSLDMLRAARNVTHVLQYSQNPNHLAISFDKLRAIDPLDDAFTATVKALLRRLCNLRKLGRRKCGRPRFKSMHGGPTLYKILSKRRQDSGRAYGAGGGFGLDGQ